MANSYIANVVLGVDPETDLNIEIRAKDIFINSETQKITIRVDKVLVSPTGVEMRVLEHMYYERYNSELNKKYDQLEFSPIGQGIKQMIQNDLAIYPNLTQN